MRSAIASLFTVGILASSAVAADRLDELFASWEKAQTDVRSLVVEFSQETLDPITKTKLTADGSFRLIRSPAGKVSASFDLHCDGAKGPEQRVSVLLADGAIYLLNHDKKQASRNEFADGQLRPFVEKCFYPVVILLDRRRAEANWTMEVVKQDEWYSYVVMNRKHANPTSWFTFEPTPPARVEIAILNKDTSKTPRDMPRLIQYSDPAATRIALHVKSWRFNGSDPPKPEEFTKPEDRPGWIVVGRP